MAHRSAPPSPADAGPWTRFAWRFGRALAQELGPREVAILTIAAGVYLMARALWPDGALGLALIVAGGLTLWVAVRPVAAREEEAPAAPVAEGYERLPPNPFTAGTRGIRAL